MTPVMLAVEDLLGEALVHRVIIQRGMPLVVDQVLQQRGKSYLRSRADSLNRAAHGGVKSILLPDADSGVCPVTLAQAWFPSGRHPNVALRFCVQESEAWVMADAAAFSGFLGVPVGKIPVSPDKTVDPKGAIISLAKCSSKKAIREGLVPKTGAVVKVGPNYNQMMSQFVRTEWDFEAASKRSPSLAEFAVRLDRLAS